MGAQWNDVVPERGGRAERCLQVKSCPAVTVLGEARRRRRFNTGYSRAMTSETSPSHDESAWRLLTTMCARPRDEATLASVLQLAKSNAFDWEDLITQATRHKLMALVANVLESASATDVVPEAVRARCSDFYEQVKHVGAAMTREAQWVCERMRVEGVTVAVTKGVALQHVLYGNDGTRQFGDIDFMVAASEIGRVAAVLGDIGYRVGRYDRASKRVMPPRREELLLYALSPDHIPRHVRVTLDSRVPSMNLDFAYSLTWARSKWQIPVEDALEHLVDVPLNSGSFPSLREDYHFLFVVLHLFREGWFVRTMHDIALAQFRDVLWMWSSLTSRVRESVMMLIERHDLRDPVGWVLAHTDELFGAKLVSECGLGLQDDSWLRSAATGKEEVVYWQGNMSKRLRDSPSRQSPPAAVR